jgi:hypothetical protein
MLIGLAGTPFICSCQQLDPATEPNVIYGDHHIFTINTPTGWVNDKVAASKIGLVSFFYAQGDSSKQRRSYFYAMGYDKGSKEESLSTFIDADLKTFKNKYPNFKYDKVEVGTSGGIINGEMYSFNNLSDRFREEVVYMETIEAILVFSFAAFTEQEFNSYQPVFDDFISSFNYRGNNPKPYLDWLEKRN